jgi:hypothetical protein
MALARSRRLGIADLLDGLLLNERAEKGAHFRPARRCGAMKDRRKLPAGSLVRNIKKF